MLNIYHQQGTNTLLNNQLREPCGRLSHVVVQYCWSSCAKGAPTCLRWRGASSASRQSPSSATDRAQHTSFPAERRAAAARVTTQASNTPDALATSGSVREDQPRDEGREADDGGWSAGPERRARDEKRRRCISDDGDGGKRETDGRRYYWAEMGHPNWPAIYDLLVGLPLDPSGR